MNALLARPIMGTSLTIGLTLATLTAAPFVWTLFTLVFVAMPS